jgi:prepilin-type N-terminal cleavage/methylation domain-containing protein
VTRSRADAGLTLVELLVATAITALIAPVLTGALVVGWRTTSDTVDRLGANHARLLVPSLFTRDVQNAKTVEKTGPGCLLGGDTLLVRLGWQETSATGVQTDRTATWVLTSGTPSTVERRWCATGSSVTSSLTVAHDVTAADVFCRASAAGPQSPTCASDAPYVDISVTDAVAGSYTANGHRRLA